MPMLAGTAMTHASGKLFSRNKLTKCAGSAEVAAIKSTTNAPMSKNGALRRCADKCIGIG